MNPIILDTIFQSKPIYYDQRLKTFSHQSQISGQEVCLNFLTLQEPLEVTTVFFDALKQAFLGPDKEAFFERRFLVLRAFKDMQNPQARHVAEIIHASYMRFMFEHAELTEDTPYCLRNDPFYVSKMIVQKGRHLLKLASCELQKNAAFVLSVIDSTHKVTKSFFTETLHPSLRNDREFIFELVQRQVDVFCFLDPIFKEDKALILEALRHSALVLTHIDPHLFDDEEFLEACVSIQAATLRFVSSDKLQKKSLVLQLVRANGFTLSWLEDLGFLQDEMIVRSALLQNGCALQFLVSSPLYLRKDITILAINQNPDAFEYAHDSFKADPEVAFLALSKRFSASYHISDELRKNPEFWRHAFDRGIIEWHQVPGDLKDKDCFLLRFFKHPALSDTLLQQIVKFPHPDLQHFIMSKLLDCFKTRVFIDGDFQDLLFHFPEKQNLSDITYLLCLIVCRSWGLKQSDLVVFFNILTAYKVELKDSKKRQAILFFLLSLEAHAPDNTLKLILIDKCFHSESSIGDILQIARMFPAVLETFMLSEVQAMDDLTLDNLKDAFAAKLTDFGLITQEHKEGFFEKLLELRDPAALIIFCATHAFKPYVHAALEMFVKSLSSDVFYQTRHEHNSYKDLLSPSQLDLWQKGMIMEHAHSDGVHSFRQIIYDSENYQDLLLCGTEVIGSCLRVDGDSHFSQALLGYLLDGKIRMIVVKESLDSRIQSRAILKIMKNTKGKPVLFLEKTYPFTRGDDVGLIRQFARQKAETLGLDLYTSGLPQILQEPLHSDVKNPGVFEYEDGILDTQGLTDGSYEILAQKI